MLIFTGYKKRFKLELRWNNTLGKKSLNLTVNNLIVKDVIIKNL